MTLIVDSFSYVVSLISLLLIRVHEPTPERKPESHLLRDIGTGLRFAFSNSYLRTGAVLAASWNFCAILMDVTFLLYAVRELHCQPGLLGLILALSGVGGVIGSASAGALARRFRLGFVFSGLFVLAVVPAFFVPAATGLLPLVIAMCITGFFLLRTALGAWNVLNTSLRQSVIPDQMRGRTQASLRMVSYVGVTLGALAAGFLGTVLGLRPTLWVASCGFLLTYLPFLFPPYPQLREMSDLTPTKEENSDGVGE